MPFTEQKKKKKKKKKNKKKKRKNHREDEEKKGGTTPLKLSSRNQKSNGVALFKKDLRGATLRAELPSPFGSKKVRRQAVNASSILWAFTVLRITPLGVWGEKFG